MTLGDAQTIISILGLTLLGTAGLMWFLPVGSCSQCSHCKLEKLARQRQRERELESGRQYVGGFCPVCGRQHRPDEDHRY